MQLRQRIARLDAGPQRIDHALAIEAAHAFDPHVERREADASQQVGDVVGAMPIDLADEAQRQVQLRIILPSRAFHPAAQRQQQGSDRGGRADGDEQAMHGSDIDESRQCAMADPVWLEVAGRSADNEGTGEPRRQRR